MFLKILQKILSFLAKGVVKKQKPQIIGITGSVGKSSVKQTTGLILDSKFNIRQSPGNYNNEIGVPLTILGKYSPGKNILAWLFIFISGFFKILFKDNSYPEILVLEMAADRPGDIKYLLKIAPCQRGVLTAIALAHTEFFKNIKGVIQEKQIIITHLSSEQWAILNADDKNVWPLRKKTKAKVLTYGFFSQADLRALDWEIVQEIKETEVKIKGSSFKVKYKGNVVPVFLPQIVSLAQVYSVLAGMAVGLTFEFNFLEMAQIVKKYQPLPGRMNFFQGKNKSLILDDTYNSSPKAVEIAFQTCQKINLPLSAKKWIVLGEMLELGNLSKKAHFCVGEKFFKAGFDYLITIGEQAREIAQGARKKGFPNEKIFSFNSVLGVTDFLKPRIKNNDLILIKGSQAVRMEKIVKELIKEPSLAKKYLVRQSQQWLETLKHKNIKTRV